MALTASQFGQVDPTRGQVDQGGVTDLTVKVYDVTVGATTDYSSGLSITPALVGMTAIYSLMGVSVRQSGGTIRAVVPLWDANTSKLRLYFDNTGTSGGVLTEASGSNLAASDVVRVVAIGA